MARPRMVTLYTDFGTRDVYAGVLRAVIRTLSPEAEVVDICHGIEPGSLHAAAFHLIAAVPYLPRGTVHLCVVDPGVGTERRILAVRAGGHTFVAPDNGVVAPVVEALGGATDLRYATNEKLHGARRSHTFHGRDIMAPLAAHLVRGIHFAQVGEEATALADLPGFAPQIGETEVAGRVLHVDNFGNLVTNLLPKELAGPTGSWSIQVGEGAEPVTRWGKTYGDAPSGELLVYTGSVGFLEIAVRDGSAAERLGSGGGSALVARRVGDA